MTTRQLVRRSLSFYWRTNLAVVLGVAAAVTVLAGALLVGDSVRGSLRDLVVQRLGRTELVAVSSGFFREALASDVARDPSFGGPGTICPIVVAQGFAIDQASGRRALGVQVYGVDDRFWQFHGRTSQDLPSAFGRTSRDILLSPALARDLGAEPGGTILLRVPRPSDVPLDSLHGQKEDLGRTLRFTLRAVLPAADLGEFSLQPQQGEVRAAFVMLSRLQQELDLKERVNTLLVASNQPNQPDLESLLRRHINLDDLGITVRALNGLGVLSVEAGGSLITEPRAEAATKAATSLRMRATPVFTYLANSIRVGDRAIPYSLVTAVDFATIGLSSDSADSAGPTTFAKATVVKQDPAYVPGSANVPIVLNEWAARDLSAKIGDEVSLDYYVWEDPGVLRTSSTTFRLAAVVPLSGRAADPDFAPKYPGITDTDNLRDWDPPFPIDLRRVRPVDEDYWHTHRTTPKAFIPFEVGQSLWRSRHGSMTSMRLTPATGISLEGAFDAFVPALGVALDPFTMGFGLRDVRAEGLAASRGATDFGEYFTYFSFFLVVSALVLAVLFFRVTVEQRAREVGLLRAVGFSTASVRRMFVTEALLLSIAGSVIGVGGAVLYAALIMKGLSTWWVDAVGTTALTLHVSPRSLAAGGVLGIAASVVSIWWTLRTLARVTERALLAGQITIPRRVVHDAPGRRISVTAVSAVGLLALGVLLVAGGFTNRIDRTGAFFGAGTCLLAASLCSMAVALARQHSALVGGGWWTLWRLGIRNASYRPGRSLLAIAVMAFATFILIAVDAFRRGDPGATTDRHSGTGGYALLVNTLLPVVHDPNGSEGKDLLGLSETTGVSITPFRVLPGDDASCLNLYEPRQPRILGATDDFIASGRFRFQSSLAASDEERANPWLLLTHASDASYVPVIADANSMTYVLHKALGDEIVIQRGGTPVRLRLVAALSDSVLQGELVMSDDNFRKLFPDQAGYQFMLVDAPAARVNEVSSAIEDRLSDFGADASPAGQRLAEFHRVENTYLSTFQTLGGLGLLLGTIGLAAVLLRNVLERRRELALMVAVGYRRAHVFTVVMAENALLLVAGLLTGTVCALVAIAPAVVERGGHLPAGASAALLLFGVLITGLFSSFVATRLTIQTRLLSALKAE